MKKEVLKVSIIYLLLSIFFFLPLFYPEPHLFVTPDFGKSDIWNFNYPLKNFLSESLKRGELPLWSKDIGAGFPVLAEGQIGTFHPLNLFLFSLLPTWQAFNLSYVFIFAFAAVGTYWFLRSISIGVFSSLMGGFIFAFSGYNIVQISHINLLLAASHLPWAFLTMGNLIKKKTVFSAIALSFVLSVQFFSGFPQISLITVIGLLLYFLYHLKSQDKGKTKLLLLSILSLCLTILLSSIQLFPTLELIQNSARKSGLDFSMATDFPYPLKHLLSFINPFIFGNPKFGTYPPFSSNWGIFWENTSYLGLLPLVFAIITVVNSKTRKQIFVWIILLIVSFFLILGKYSPLYLVFTVPPFSIFRVPSRFLLIFTFSLTVISVYGLESIKKLSENKTSKKIVRLTNLLIFGVIVANIFFVWKDYHPITSVEEWLREPNNSVLLKKTDNIRIETIPNVYETWNKTFLNKGWQKAKLYKEFQEDLNANLNMVYHIPSLSIYSSFLPSRQAFISQLSQNLYTTDNDKLQISTVSASINNIFSVTHIISPKEIDDPTLTLEKVQENSIGKYYLYKNTKALPRIRFVTNSVLVSTVNEVNLLLEDKERNFDNLVILENGKELKGEKAESKLSVKEENNNKLVIELDTDKSGYLIVADAYYPGWKAYVNGKKSPIILANLNQKAVWLETGKNEISLNYDPSSIKKGFWITILSIFPIIIYLAAFLILSKKSPSIFHNAFVSFRRQNNPWQL